MKSSVECVVSPPGRLPSVDWVELWRYRDLFLVLAWRDISVRYKQTALGVLWAVFQPLLTMVVFTFVFNRMAGLESGDGTPYPVFLYVGLLLWQYFSNTLTNASNSMITNASLIQKVYFPRLIIPAASVVTGLVDLSVAAVVLAGMMVYYGFTPAPAGLLALPVLLATTILAASGLGLFTAAVSVKFRDVRYALPFFIQTLLYVTPVIYPVRMLDRVPCAAKLMLWLNPMSGVITNARAGILGRAPVDLHSLWVSLLVSAVFFGIGLCYFRSTERYFADIV